MGGMVEKRLRTTGLKHFATFICLIDVVKQLKLACFSVVPWHQTVFALFSWFCHKLRLPCSGGSRRNPRPIVQQRQTRNKRTVGSVSVGSVRRRPVDSLGILHSGECLALMRRWCTVRGGSSWCCSNVTCRRPNTMPWFKILKDFESVR